jgi:hypothetical protein
MTPIAIAKSNIGLFFFYSAGDKLMTTFLSRVWQSFA